MLTSDGERALRWSLLHALAERDDALWTLKRVNERAQVPADVWPDYRLLDALRDIRAMVQRRLGR